jgi:hypothetical protein
VRFTRELPQLGDRREKSFFTFLPYTVGTETRWMEKVTVLQEYKNKRIASMHVQYHYGTRWVDLEWVENELV